MNDSRQTKYKGEISIAANGYANPKVPDTSKIQQKEHNLNLLKKPPIPKQQTQVNNSITNDQQPFSFLQGNKPSKEKKDVFLPDHIKTMKNGIPKPPTRNPTQLKSKTPQIPKQMMSKQPEVLNYDGDLLD